MKFLTLAVITLVAVAKGQDMTSLMFQAMGMDAPPLPPTMPSSLRQHLYSQERMKQQQIQLQQRHLLQQRRQILALREAQRQRDRKLNPYSVSYSDGMRSSPSSQNMVNSPANTIRRPGSMLNSVQVKVNPYTVENPYSTSRQENSRVPGVRKSGSRSTLPSNRRSAEIMQQMATLRTMSALPKKIKDAKMAGCKLPVDSAAASVLMFNTCQLPAAQLICQSEMMQCNTVGMAAMCCPLGMNNLAMDTISYVNKLQNFVADIA